MSLLLASIEKMAEASAASRADIIDCKRGLFSPWSRRELARLVRQFPGKTKSAVLGTFPNAERAASALRTAPSGFDYLKLGLRSPSTEKIGDFAEFLTRLLPKKSAAVLTLFAEEYRHRRIGEWLSAAARAGFRVVMLDTLEKGRGNLFTKLSPSQLATTARAAATEGLWCGFAGGLTETNLAEYLKWGNDYPSPRIFGLRGGLCAHGRKELQAQKVERIAHLLASHAKATAGPCLEASLL